MSKYYTAVDLIKRNNSEAREEFERRKRDAALMRLRLLDAKRGKIDIDEGDLR